MSRIVVFAAAALLLMLGAAAPARADLPWAVPTPMATGPGAQCAPSLAGDMWNPHVTWQDDAAGQWDVVSLLGLVSTPIPDGSGQQRNPVTAGYVVVYEDDRAGNWDMVAYDTFPGDDSVPPPTVRETRLTTGVAHQLDPDTDGVTVVWEDAAGGNWDIVAYDLETRSTRVVTTDRADQVDPAVDRGKVVFADRRNGNWDIYCYDLWKRSLKRLTTNRDAQTMPDIDRGIVVYQDKRNGNWDVYAYFLHSGQERRLTSSPANQTAPRISDHRSVVYQDDRAGAPDLCVHDLETRTNGRLIDDAAAQTEPALLGALVAWRDARTDAGDVYLAEILYPDVGLWLDTDDATPPAYGDTVRFAGTLSVPYGRVDSLSVLVSGAGKTRKVAVTPIDETAGRYSVAVRNVVRKVTLRALFRHADYLPDSARPVSVKPRALLTRPSLTVLPRDTSVPYPSSRDVVISGYLKPRHPAGSRAVAVECWLREWSPVAGSRWKLDRTVRAVVRDHDGYSSYRLRLSLRASPIFGALWKVRAIHADADHAKTVSSFSATKNLLD